MRLKDHGLLLLGLTLAIGLVISTVIAARSFERVRLTHQTITVKGYAERPITSDHGVWTGRFSVRAPEIPDAYALLEQHLDIVTGYLGSAGVPPEAVTASAIATQTLFKRDDKGNETQEAQGYLLTQSITVASDKVDLIDRISKESTTLLQRGVALTSQPPAYFYSKLDAMKTDMLGAAMKDAKARAQTLADNSGASVGPLVQADQGVFQITPPHSTDVSGYGENDTTSILKSIKAVVTAEFAVR